MNDSLPRTNKVAVIGVSFAAFYAVVVVVALVLVLQHKSPDSAGIVASDNSLPTTESGDLPVVKEGEDKTGEILPPADTSGQPQVDIAGDDLSFPPQ